VARAKEMPGVLATCLLEWFPPPPNADQTDVEAGAAVVAEMVVRVVAALTKG
jgi:hypothetical protein